GRSQREERTRFHEVVHRVNAILGEIDCRLPQTTYRCTADVGSDYRDTSLQAGELDRVTTSKRKVDDLPGVDNIGNAGAGGVDDLLAGRDRDRFTRRADF